MTASRPVLEFRVACTTADFDRLVRFYSDGLGVEPTQLWTGAQDRALILELGTATLEIFDEAHATVVDQIETGQRLSGAIRFALQVPDLPAALERLLAHGATLVHPPVVTPWGHHNVRVQDPDGLQVTLFQVLDSEGADQRSILHARGTFEVQLTPQALAHGQADATLGRLMIDKQFEGDLAATSQGEMLSARTAVEDSAGYVAIERVSGTLHGRHGSFLLQHSGTLTRGAQQLTIGVVPDSGTEELAGLAGTMTLTIAEGVHAYDFAYTLPDQS